MSTPPPPSPTTIVEEQEPVQQADVSPEVYERVIPEALRARASTDAKLKSFFQTLPALFQSAQTIRTTTPLKASKKIYGQQTTIFTRIHDGGDISGHEQTVTDYQLPTTPPE